VATRFNAKVAKVCARERRDGGAAENIALREWRDLLTAAPLEQLLTAMTERRREAIKSGRTLHLPGS